MYELNTPRYMFSRKPHMVVVPYLYADGVIDEIIISICGKVKKILNLQWEQVYNGNSLVAKRTPIGMAKLATHICWGLITKKRLEAAGIKNAIITGAPQMDFAKPAFRAYFYTKKELCETYNLDTQKKIILFISSFSYWNLSKKEIGRIQSLVDFDVNEFRKITNDTKTIVLKWFQEFLDEHPEYVIVYRPHPAEKDDQRLNEFETRNKCFRVIKELSVKQWILISDMVLNWYSTSGVEALFAGINCLYLRPIPIPRNIDYVMYTKVCIADSYSIMIDYIEHPSKIESYYKYNNIEQDISEYYLKDESYAIFNIASLIEEMLKSNKFDMDLKYSQLNQFYKLLKIEYKRLCTWLYFKYPKIANNTVALHNGTKKSLQSYVINCKNIATNEEIFKIEQRLRIILKC